MKEPLKIAIPTTDGLLVGSHYKRARGFFVATVTDGAIIHQELRWNLLSEIMTSEHGFLYNLDDCDVILMKRIGTITYDLLQQGSFRIVRTDQSGIQEALTGYLQTMPLFNEKITTA